MKREELTTDIMINRGWKPLYNTVNILLTQRRFPDYYDELAALNATVANIQKKDTAGNYIYKLRCVTVDDECHYKEVFEMCSTYKVRYKNEYLEMAEGDTWDRIATREIETGRMCIYAD